VKRQGSAQDVEPGRTVPPTHHHRPGLAQGHPALCRRRPGPRVTVPASASEL